TDTLIAAAAAGDHGVDSDNLPVDIGEGTAAVAGIDGRIGLDEVLEARNLGIVNIFGAAGESADDSRGDGCAEPERRTDRDRPVAYLQSVRITNTGRHNILFVDLDDRKIRVFVGSDDGRGILVFIIGEAHANASRLFEHGARAASEKALEELFHAVVTVIRRLLLRLWSPPAESVSRFRLLLWDIF